MTLLAKQQRFCILTARLILWSSENGYQLTYGEAWRTLEQAQLNAKTGKGIVKSLHGLRLAVDLNLFIGGKYQINSAAYKPMGEYWKSLDSGCRWGGDFPKRDGNHFSIEHDGIR